MGFVSKVMQEREDKEEIFNENKIKPSLADRVVAFFGNYNAEIKIAY